MVYILEDSCKFLRKILREYACLSAGPMKLTPTLILLLNTLLYGNNLRQIFISNYWHALPAAICNIGVAIYLERHPEVQKCFNRYLRKDLAKVVSEALVLWAALTASSFSWMLAQGAIYRSVRILLMKMSPPAPAPLAILWQPQPSWREFSAQHSDAISLVVALAMASAVLVVGLSSARRHVEFAPDTWGRHEYPAYLTAAWAEYDAEGVASGPSRGASAAAAAGEGAWCWEGVAAPSKRPPPAAPAPLPDFIPQPNAQPRDRLVGVARATHDGAR